jgi:diguanylate cyclase (GGDEF)-like protein/PAS domain S-box-containing protein
VKMDKKIILIVDDEFVNIDIIAKILRNSYDLKVAKDGQEAFEVLKSSHIDLILLDIVMPNMDGYELAKRLKKDAKLSHIPFIYLTAKSDTKSIVKGFEYGAVDYIAKPFVKEELLARVDTHLKVHSLNKSLQNSVEEMNLVFSESYDGIALTDLDTNFLLVNDAYERITGLTKEELYKTSCRELTYGHPDDYFLDVIKYGRVKNIERRCEVRGKKIDINLSVSLMPDKKRLLLNAKDVTESKKIQRKIEHDAQLMDENIISSSTDLDGNIITVSKAFEKISGYKKDELVGKKHSIARHTDMPKEVYDDLWATITKGKVWRGEIKNKTKDGSSYWSDSTIIPDFDEDGNKIGYTAIRQNITSKKQIEDISIRDELTQLFNRRHFNKVFEDEVNRAKRSESNFLFMMIDVDHFKKYNDHYGHQEGDNVLQKIGKVLNKFTKRSGDYAFRLGGEEFGIISQNKPKEQVLALAESIRDAIESLQIEHAYNGECGFVTISIGLFFTKLSMDDSTKTIYKESDKLLYKAKDSGRNQICF